MLEQVLEQYIIYRRIFGAGLSHFWAILSDFDQFRAMLGGSGPILSGSEQFWAIYKQFWRVFEGETGC